MLALFIALFTKKMFISGNMSVCLLSFFLFVRSFVCNIIYYNKDRRVFIYLYISCHAFSNFNAKSKYKAERASWPKNTDAVSS